MKELFNKSKEQDNISPISEKESMIASELESMIEIMSDDEVKKLISDCNKLLNKRERQYKKQVQAQIKKMAVEAGIKVSFANKPKSKSG